MDLSKYSIKDTDAKLICKHCVRTDRCRVYTMPCVILKKTKKGLVKIIVFGDRDWKGRNNIKHIRYVNPDRLIKESDNA